MPVIEKVQTEPNKPSSSTRRLVKEGAGGLLIATTSLGVGLATLSATRGNLDAAMGATLATAAAGEVVRSKLRK